MSFGNGYNGGRTSMVRQLNSIRYHVFWWSIDWWRIFLDSCPHFISLTIIFLYRSLLGTLLILLYFDLFFTNLKYTDLQGSFECLRSRASQWLSLPGWYGVTLIRFDSIRFDSNGVKSYIIIIIIITILVSILF